MNFESLKLRDGVLILLVLSIPYTNITLGSPYLFLPMVIFILYFLLSINYLNNLLRISSIKDLFWPFVFLWMIFLISSLLNYVPFYLPIMRSVLQRLIIYFVFFLIIYNELKNDSKLQFIIQRTIVASIMLTVFFYYTGIGVEYYDGRLIILKTNANLLGVLASIVIVMAIDLIIIQKAKRFYFFYLVIAIILAFMIMTLTGSRKAILILGVGILVYFVLLNRSIQYKLIRLVPFVLIGFIAYKSIMSNELIAERINTEFTHRDYGGRLPIWEATVEIIKDYPIMGAGIGEFSDQITRKLGRLRVTHNEFLTVLAYGGFLGLLLFLFFLTAIARRSLLILRIKNSSFSSLPISLFSMIFIFIATAGGALTDFFTWFILAFIVAKSEVLPQIDPVGKNEIVEENPYKY